MLAASFILHYSFEAICTKRLGDLAECEKCSRAWEGFKVSISDPPENRDWSLFQRNPGMVSIVYARYQHLMLHCENGWLLWQCHSMLEFCNCNNGHGKLCESLN